MRELAGELFLRQSLVSIQGCPYFYASIVDLKKPKSKRRFGFPKFKNKHGFKQSYKTNFTNGNIQVRENYLKLPKLGWVRFHKSAVSDGTIINVTITRTKTGKYVASILCETEVQSFPAADKNIGLDLGIKTYLVTSNSEEIENPVVLNK